MNQTYIQRLKIEPYAYTKQAAGEQVTISAGTCRFRGPRKGTPFAAVAGDAIRTVVEVRLAIGIPSYPVSLVNEVFHLLSFLCPMALRPDDPLIA